MQLSYVLEEMLGQPVDKQVQKHLLKQIASKFDEFSF
jgi:hypothetical protein